MSTKYEQAFNVFATFPEGLTCFEFEQLLDDPRSTSKMLSLFWQEGLAEKGAKRVNPKTGIAHLSYIPTGVPFSQRITRTQIASSRKSDRADNELIELRQWKAEAIKRFPELGLDPLVKKARSTVADIFRREGNQTKAALIESGELDDGDTMRAVLSVLRNAA